MPSDTNDLAAPGWTAHPSPFPAARRDETASTTYNSAAKGKVTVPEPYLWLETPPSQSQETKQWVHAQARLTQSYLESCQPDLDILKKRLERNLDFARASNPSLKGDDNYYYSYNSGLSPQSIIYRASKDQVQHRAGNDDQAGSNPTGEIFFDVNLLDAKGTVALSLTSFSKTGRYFAYGVSKSGSDWFKIYFRQTDKPFRLPAEHYSENGTIRISGDQLAPYIDATGGKDRLDDVLDDIKFSGASWTHDDAGLFYQRFPSLVGVQDKGTETDANKDAQLWYHRIGTSQADDVLVIPSDTKIPESMWSTSITDDGRYLCVRNSRDTDTKSRYFVASLHDQQIGDQMRWVPLSLGFKYDLDYVGNVGDRFYFLTNKDAPNYRLVYCDIDFGRSRAGPVWSLEGDDVELRDHIAEDAGALLSSVSLVAQNKLLVVYSRDVKDELYQYDLVTGKRIERLLPDLVGTISQISGRKDDDHAFVQFVSFVNPGQIVRLDWTGKTAGSDKVTSQKLYSSTRVAGIRSEDFVSEQIFITSKDGTRVPMFVTHPKSLERNGSAPAILYFYGGFNIPIMPSFVPTMMTWAASYNGVMAFVNARGGGEYGDKWHEAGSLLNKQNVFDDVLSAARHLHESGYAQKGKIILSGGSNGGLGVAACVNQCADEHGVGAGIADVGVMDMLKFHTWTIGKAWTADYGNPSEDPEIFDYNYRYSPLHNVDPNKIYPTTILACADHDDRVVPAHSFKLMAEMQHKLPNNPNPLLLRVELDAGHGAGKSTQKRIQEAAEKYAITARALGLEIQPEDAEVVGKL
ncbi:uncharacterized protein PFL1_03326 [Pseudozyma flocculosa PF-1]|uniref:Prolyl endopeptidase n=2 Tax=Pseudozyma flocculosa TaxID=84751 RepID=A0A5C3F778_9BASI|nr:uncharacterized protein PFL1_03326 [Pseudozyma flocculosa PF-1]EPQ29036.1 hypothetical protein PFL1_03326 [Pseudozyma flocculosa PF-1]SPO40030.1 related to Prolyl endopeptidase [Pseudozyma flocculosa]